MAMELQATLHYSWRCILMFSMMFLLLSSNCIMAVDPLKFIVVDDWDRKGLYNQSQVVAQMGKIAQPLNIDFVISTGDHFYEDGLNGTDDPSFEQSFFAIYTTSSLQKPWHLVFGNHDYRGDTLSQLDPALKRWDDRWNCYIQNLPFSCKEIEGAGVQTISCTPLDYMTTQVEINEKMRAILIDWLIEVHLKFELMPETLYLTLNIIDRYLSIHTTTRRKLQLVGSTAMLIGCKHE